MKTTRGKLIMINDRRTFKRSMLRTAVRSALAFSVVAGLGVNTASAAEEEEAEENEQRILVTGSRIRRDEFGSPSPIQILTTEDAKKAGVTTIAEMLQRISMANGAQIDATINTNSGTANATEPPPAGGVGSQNVGLRGLGAERTLILINGRRLGASGVRGAPSQPDLSLIPFDLVERVEVLSDSASAVYGADAVAGVINVILKDSIDGVRVSANISSPSDPGGDVKQFSFVTGGESENSSFVFGFEFYERDRVSGSDRIDCIRRREIDIDNGDVYSYCYNTFPDNAALTPESSSTWAYYTPGQSDIINSVNGLPVPNWSSNNGIPDPVGGYPDFLVTPIGQARFRLNPNYNDNFDRLRADLVQPVTRFSLMANGTYNPTWGQDDNIEIFYDTSYFHRHLNNRASLEQIFPDIPATIPQENGQGGLLQNPDGSLQQFDNPLSPFGQVFTPIITVDDINQDRDVELDHFRV
ncbi:MAG: TonB-dependent receptor plug domain-containing protein, partial [Kangiellaceae bacterium]|nr:TonB-dependent receptor plug domain-containing protein [Kangiellaceae bacterium]